jgi:hypothetical protein
VSSKKPAAHSRLLAPKTSQKKRVVNARGSTANNGNETAAHSALELPTFPPILLPWYAQSINCAAAWTSPTIIATITTTTFLAIALAHFLFELAGVEEFVDDDGFGSVAVADENHGTLKDELRGSFARGGGDPGFPNPTFDSYAGFIHSNWICHNEMQRRF